MRILALVPGGISQQLLFFPTLENIQKKYPNATIDVLVEPRAKGVYRVCPSIHDVLIFDYKDRNGLADYLNLLGVIRDQEYDVAIFVGQSWAMGLLLWLNGIPLRVGYKTQSSWFLSNPVPLKTEQYIAYEYHDLLQGLGIQAPCPPIRVILPTSDINWAEAEQKRLELKDPGYILIHCDATQEADYPLPQWLEIVDRIQEKQPNLPIVLLQDNDSAELVGKLQENRSNLRVTRPSDVGKLAAIIAGANLMLCTDTIPLQVSVAVGTYTIALFGSSEARKLLPPNQDRFIGIQSPTGKIADIKPETVLQQMWGS
jgi:ADP-heptose:LPS heptosyltransferase